MPIRTTLSIKTNNGIICKMLVFIWIIIFITTTYAKSKQKEIDEHQKSLLSFRLKMEELPEDQAHKVIKDESSDKFVSFLIDNVKELFPSTDNLTITMENSDNSFDSNLLFDALKNATKPDSYKKMQSNIHSSATEKTSLDILKPRNAIIQFDNSNKTESQLLKFIEEDSKIKNQRRNIALKSIKLSIINVSSLVQDEGFGLSCISCDNVINENCNDPRFKLIPSKLCKREDDLCYSQHTPFGIIDRGCFNINHNLTLFVCACNLCNYISIFEMPYIFSNKRDWIENVIELSRAKRFRESIFKDMSCLRCEVNVTAKTGDMVADANCLEGNIAMLPHQVCASDEICAVKAVRSEGYMWRGCVSEPLYNYWWTLCDSDLCNYDTIASVYDSTDT